MKIINFVGDSGSGKTRTIELLIDKLTKMGKKVGTMKHIHSGSFSFDYRGKDTWKHVRAGASIVVAVTENEVITIEKTSTRAMPTEELLNRFNGLDIEYLLIEGFKTRMLHLNNVKHVLCVTDVNQIFSFNEQYGNPDCIVSYSIKGINKINDVQLVQMPEEIERLAEIVL
ncbi:MAG: molybdopterin-guanine dinucleotide biosynthesis protein B [Conexivisphaerales archaeon]